MKKALLILLQPVIREILLACKHVDSFHMCISNKTVSHIFATLLHHH